MDKNSNSFKEIFDTHYQGLCYFASKYLSEADSPEDIVQEVFIALWEKYSDFSDINHLKAFLYTSVRNSCLNQIKHNNVKANYQFSQSIDNEQYTDNEIIEEEVYSRLYSEISNLPESCRKIILLSLEGLSNNEISEKLNITNNTIKTHKQLAMKKLKAKLEIFRKLLYFF